VMDRMLGLVAAVSKIPVSVLAESMAPKGLGTNDDKSNWYDTLEAEREIIKPKIERVIRLVMRSKEGPTGGQIPKGWKLVFPSLWQLTPAEESERRNKQADTDTKYINAGVLTPEEVSTSRFRAEGWNAETQIDLGVRKQMQESDRASAVGAKQLPKGKAGAAQMKALPAPSGATAPGAQVDKDPTTALNGAQIVSLLSIVTSVATKQIPRDTGARLIAAAFPITPAQAALILGSVGEDFVPAAPAVPGGTVEEKAVG